jgi:hypothetical protein
MALVYSSLYEALRGANVSPELATEAAKVSNYARPERPTGNTLQVCLVLTAINVFISFLTLVSVLKLQAG